jgi:uncharacterized membrane protein YeaQ/YmgE (transglycosylase-associated protein family)
VASIRASLFRLRYRPPIDIVALIFGLLIGGLIIGALARLAVPGPDPMPIWLTMLIGVGGAVIAGLVGQLLFDEPNGGFVVALLAAIAIVIAYRRFVQGRGITGPEAKRLPTRGIGVRAELEEKLRDLREAGLLTADEFEVKRAQLRSRA